MIAAYSRLRRANSSTVIGWGICLHSGVIWSIPISVASICLRASPSREAISIRWLSCKPGEVNWPSMESMSLTKRSMFLWVAARCWASAFISFWSSLIVALSTPGIAFLTLSTMSERYAKERAMFERFFVKRPTVANIPSSARMLPCAMRDAVSGSSIAFLGI